MSARPMFVSTLLVLAAAGATPPARPAAAGDEAAPRRGAAIGRVTHTDAEWQRLLTPRQYDVLRRAGTERAFSGAYWNEHRPGRYRCAGCGLELFEAAQKFDSGTGWPSFWRPAAPARVVRLADSSFGMRRIAVECGRCGGHLGHVFDDGPPPTGLRYCINSAALTFVPAT